MGRCKRGTKRRCLPLSRRSALLGVFPNKGRSATPARLNRTDRRVPGAARRSGARIQPLSPIKECQDAGPPQSVIPEENSRVPPPQLHQTESVSCSVMGGSADNDSSSDIILPSGVSTFFLDCMDSGLQASSSPSSRYKSDSSYPSPEVFRALGGSEETTGFTWEEELEELQVKNSTLLDTSHAVDINMRQPPNLSAILGSIAEKTLSERKIQPGKKASSSGKGTKKIDGIRPVRCRKKVNFQSAVGKGPRERAEQPCGLNVTQMAQDYAPGTETRPLSLAEVQLGDREQAGVGKVDPEKDESERSPTEGTVVAPRALSQKKARFFHFPDEETKNFVLRKREKYNGVFPSRPLILKASPSPDEIRPVYVKFKNSELHDPEKLYMVSWMQLLHEGEATFNSPRFKKVQTNEGVIYEDYGRIRNTKDNVFCEK